MDSYLLVAIIVMAVVNLATRVLPFMFFRDSSLPAPIRFLESYFPPVIMTILVFYSLKDIDFNAAPYGIFELSAVAMTIALHLIFKNYLLSIFGSTILYMGLVQGWFGI